MWQPQRWTCNCTLTILAWNVGQDTVFNQLWWHLKGITNSHQWSMLPKPGVAIVVMGTAAHLLLLLWMPLVVNLGGQVSSLKEASISLWRQQEGNAFRQHLTVVTHQREYMCPGVVVAMALLLGMRGMLIEDIGNGVVQLGYDITDSRVSQLGWCCSGDLELKSHASKLWLPLTLPRKDKALPSSYLTCTVAQCYLSKKKKLWWADQSYFEVRPRSQTDHFEVSPRWEQVALKNSRSRTGHFEVKVNWNRPSFEAMHTLFETRPSLRANQAQDQRKQTTLAVVKDLTKAYSLTFVLKLHRTSNTILRFWCSVTIAGLLKQLPRDFQ